MPRLIACPHLPSVSLSLNMFVSHKNRDPRGDRESQADLLRARGCELAAAALDRQAAAHAAGAHANHTLSQRAPPPQRSERPPPPPPSAAAPPYRPQPCVCTGPAPRPSYNVTVLVRRAEAGALAGRQWAVRQGVRALQSAAVRAAQARVGLQRTLEGVSRARQTVKEARISSALWLRTAGTLQGLETGMQRTLEGLSRSRQTFKEAGVGSVLWSRTAGFLQGLEAGVQGAAQQTLAVAQNVTQRFDAARVVKALNRACLGELFL